MDLIPSLVEDLFPRVIARDLERGWHKEDPSPFRKMQQTLAGVDVGQFINTEVLPKTERKWTGQTFISALQDFDEKYARAKPPPAPSWPRGWKVVDVVPKPTPPSPENTTVESSTTVTMSNAKPLPLSSSVIVIPRYAPSTTTSTAEPAVPVGHPTTQSIYKVLSELWDAEAGADASTGESPILEDFDLEPWDLEEWGHPVGVLRSDPLYDGIKSAGVIPKRSRKQTGPNQPNVDTTVATTTEIAPTITPTTEDFHGLAATSLSGDREASVWTGTTSSSSSNSAVFSTSTSSSSSSSHSSSSSSTASSSSSRTSSSTASSSSSRTSSSTTSSSTSSSTSGTTSSSTSSSTSGTTPSSSSSTSFKSLAASSSSSETTTAGGSSSATATNSREVTVSVNSSSSGTMSSTTSTTGTEAPIRSSISTSSTATSHTTHTDPTSSSNSSNLTSSSSSPPSSTSSQSDSATASQMLGSSTSTSNTSDENSLQTSTLISSSSANYGTTTSTNPSSTTSSPQYTSSTEQSQTTMSDGMSSSTQQTSSSRDQIDTLTTETNDLQSATQTSSSTSSELTTTTPLSSSTPESASSSSTEAGNANLTDIGCTSTSTSMPAVYETTTSSTRLPASKDKSLGGIKHTYMTDKSPLEALVEQADMQIIAGTVKKNDKYETLKTIGMTLFVPTDQAFDGLPFDLKAVNTEVQVKPQNQSNSDWTEPPPCLGCQSMMRPHFAYKPPLDMASAQSKVLKDFEDLVMFHVVRRQIPPGMIEKRKTFDMRTEMKGSSLSLNYGVASDSKEEMSGLSSNGHVVVGDNGARVLEVVHCKNGFVYKLDRPLTPAFNNQAPSLMEYVSSNPQYSKLHYIFKHSNLFNGWISKAGPITVFLIRDDGWRVNGLPVPDCFFKALVRPANRDMLMKILRWVTIPGIWRRREIEESQWLLNTEAPSLMVNHIYRRADASGNQSSYKRPAEEKVEIYGEPEGPRRPTDPLRRQLVEEPSPFTGNDDLIVLVEGKEVIEWNIPLHNGYAHVLSELPMRPDIDLTPILWDCLDFLCIECPIVTKFVLKWLDNGGLLPDVSNPKAYIVPNGIRPDWVCSNHRNWFPAGWDLKEWKKYIEGAKKLGDSGDHRHSEYKHVQKLAKEGWTKAAMKREQLLDQYEEARAHLRRIWAYYADPQNYVVGKKEDPSYLMGFLVSHRDLEIKPKICEPKDRSYQRRHGYPQQTQPYLSDEDDDIGFTYDDWKYITQWI